MDEELRDGRQEEIKKEKRKKEICEKRERKNE